ncbi:hypothetical protein K1719_002806 [Acacia pycnantha]|nr:hypothetical protein K1719_002806 [Acacia pycnantha]
MAVSSDNSGLLFEAEVNDDVFYAEIRDWILQLTNEKDKNNNNVGQLLRETKHVKNPLCSAAVTMVLCTGYGTGVFISQAVVGCNKNPPRTDRINNRRSL